MNRINFDSLDYIKLPSRISLGTFVYHLLCHICVISVDFYQMNEFEMTSSRSSDETNLIELYYQYPIFQGILLYGKNYTKCKYSSVL